ncbi:MAG: 6-phosphofructokinase [Elusimicrobiota bacterium]|jgi:6-phosphofructokinase 1|nr:6-phosphofructokinase [Elusimicrobiota bacterium]
MNLGIITSGGDCGGLNAVVKGAAKAANNLGIKIFVIPNGYAGLYNLIEFDSLVELSVKRTEEFSAVFAGSEAGHSRVKIKKIDDPIKYERIKEGLKKFDIDGLVISGGDDTGNVIVDLLNQGIKCVHAPKTMDLDLQPYSVGGDSTINRIASFVFDLKTTGKTHNRVIVVEVFGRYAGHTAFRGGIGAEADAILIPEIPTDFDILYKDVKTKLCKRIKENDVYAGTYTIVVAEGMKDASGKEIVDETAGLDSFGHKKLAGAGKYVCQELNKRFGKDIEITKFMKETKLYVKGLYEIPEVREVRPGHLVRCGKSSAFDVNFGLQIGGAAVILLKNDIYGVSVVDVKNGKIRYMKTQDAIIQRHVDEKMVSFYEKLGFCFGRKVNDDEKIDFELLTCQPERYL